MRKSVVVHFQGGVNYYGLSYSLCDLSKNTQMVTERQFVTCQNCLKKITAKECKDAIRKKAEDDIAILAKSMDKNNVIQITAACNQRWRQYEKTIGI